MIKITQVDYLKGKTIQVHFSDGSWGDYNLQSLIDKQTTLTKTLEDETSFKQFYLEMGALCWRNGLELSPSNIHHKLEQQQKLQYKDKVA
jgi:hypothetical protein